MDEKFQDYQGINSEKISQQNIEQKSRYNFSFKFGKYIFSSRFINK